MGKRTPEASPVSAKRAKRVRVGVESASPSPISLRPRRAAARKAVLDADASESEATDEAGEERGVDKAEQEAETDELARGAGATRAPESPSRRVLRDIIRDTRSGIPAQSALERRNRIKAERLEQLGAKLSRREDKGSASSSAMASSSASSSSSSTVTPAVPLPLFGPRVELVDGQLRIAQDSLVVVAQREDPQKYDVVYENNSRVTSSSYTQRTKSDRWTTEETEQFFRALSQFGTDFSVIAQLFPNRSRKQLKNKFKKEEREHPERLESALRHKMPIDEAEFDSRMRARAGSSDTAAVPAAAEEAAADAGGAQAEEEAEAETAQAPRGDP